MFTTSLECFRCEASNKKKMLPSWYVMILFDPVPVTRWRETKKVYVEKYFLRIYFLIFTYLK